MHIDYIKNYIYLFRTIFGKQKWRILLLSVLGFLNGILDSIGIGALIPLFAIVAKDTSPQANYISDLIGRFFAYGGFSLNLRTILFFMAFVFLAKAVGEFLVAYIRIRIITQYEYDTRTNLYQRTLLARWPYLMQQKIGHLENILMNDVRASMGLLNRICNVAPSLASFIVYLSIALKTSLPITIITLTIGGMILLFTKPITSRVKRYSNEITSINKMIAHHVNENVQGMKMVKALAIEHDITKTESRVFDSLKQLAVRSSFAKQIGAGFVEPIMFVYISFVFAFLYSRPGFSIGSFVVVMYLIQRLFNSVNKMQGSMLTVSESMPYAYHVMGLEREVRENEEKHQGDLPFRLEHDIRFDRVSFNYHTEQPVLRDISFIIKKK